MKTFNLTIKGREIPVYVGELTKHMAVRFGSYEYEGSGYEVPCNYFKKLWLTNVGIFGTSIEDLLAAYIMYRKINIKDVRYILVEDDAHVFSMPAHPVEGVITHFTEVKDVDSKTIKW